MIKKFTLLFFLAYFLGGCVFTPQAVVIKPGLNLSSSSIGNNKTIRLNVVDERSSSTIGNRGLNGGGAEITIQGDLAEIFSETLTKGLSSQSFNVSEALVEDQRELRVELRSLEYRLAQGLWSGTLITESSIKAICLLNQSRPYEKLYRGKHKESIQIAQTEAENNKYINKALSISINKLMSDKALLQCLAQ